MPYTRADLEKLEEKFLKSYAVKSSKSKGRKFNEPKDKFRLAFQIDRDRIVHSKAFRRLKGKTQVFISTFGDHFRTRLSHTLEVAELSRDIARNLGLNEDLAQSIALAHDLGHTPFGHAGEEAMNEIMKSFNLGFEHNRQSKRVVEFLEKGYPGWQGLNLSHEVLEGLMKHQTSYDNAGRRFHSFCLEAQVVDMADEITYQTHDLDDGIRSGLIDLKNLKDIELFNLSLEKAQGKYGKIEVYELLDRIISGIMTLMVRDVFLMSERNINKFQIKDLEDIKKVEGKIITFTPKFAEKNKQLKEFLWEKVYLSKMVYAKMRKGKEIIKLLFEKYFKNPKLLPPEIRQKIDSNNPGQIVIKDYIAGMTDEFAREQYERIDFFN